jgi:filamentous hemagglutinin family protein
VAGTGSISQAGNSTDIRQSSRNLSIDWQSFNVSAQQSVDFFQPSTSAVAVNRIIGSDGSKILGRITANGQIVVYCGCPNEVSAVHLVKRLRTLGHKGAQPLAGGIESWSAAGMPLEFEASMSASAAER